MYDQFDEYVGLVTGVERPVELGDGAHELFGLSQWMGAESSVDRWKRKAQSVATAWDRVYHGVLALPGIVLLLAVAQHETWCGDAWPGENNWGACQRPDGRLTKAEYDALKAAGIAPHPSNVAKARAVLPARRNGALHADSSPRTGWYFVWFYAFDTEVDGAELFVRTISEYRPSCKSVIDHAGSGAVVMAGPEFALAAAMYRSRYYEGTHDPNQPGGVDANINDYARALRSLTPTITAALAAPVLVTPVPSGLIDVASVKGVQRALAKLGFNPGPVDGISGSLTKTAVMRFQAKARIAVDGVVGPDTRAALVAALAKLPP